MDTLSIVQTYIIRELLDTRQPIGPDDSLIASGLLDSLSVFELIAFLEDTFEVTVERREMVPENFQTLNAIKSFLDAKLAAR